MAKWKEVTNSQQAYPAFRAKCVGCGEPLHSDSRLYSMWANLEGPSFTYYCGTCVNQLEWGNQSNQSKPTVK